MSNKSASSHNHLANQPGLLAMASHDLRTPLTIIQGYGQLLEGNLSADADPLLREAAVTIVAYAKSFQYLIQNLTALEQSERGELRLSPTRRDLNELAGAALAEIDGLLTIKGVSLDCHLAPSAVWIEADPDHIARALYSLLAHAEKSARPGGKLRLEVVGADDFGRVLLSDPDRILSPERIGRLFELEQHADLGLIAARSIVEAHGGRLVAHGEPGEGVSFGLYLPRAETTTEVATS
jgi:signal transduction histidine kinase